MTPKQSVSSPDKLHNKSSYGESQRPSRLLERPEGNSVNNITQFDTKPKRQLNESRNRGGSAWERSELIL